MRRGGYVLQEADGGAPELILIATGSELGLAVDAAAGNSGKPSKGKGLSSSRIFSLGKGGKSMILLKDSAALKAAPGPKAKTPSR